MYFKVVEQAPVVLQSNHLLHLWVGDLEVGSRPTTHPPEQYGDPYLPFQAVMDMGTGGVHSKILGEVESGEFVDSLEVGGEERAKVKTTEAPFWSGTWVGTPKLHTHSLWISENAMILSPAN